MGEIRPTLIKVAICANLPAAVISDDTQHFSLTYIDPQKPDCIAPDGKKGASMVSLYTAGSSDSVNPAVLTNKYCEARP
jgi:hypothetical protein